MEYVDWNCFSQRSGAMLAFFAIGFSGFVAATIAAVALAPLFRKA